MTENILIVAGGAGLRMGAEMPKQFLEIAGLPVLMHTVLRMAKALPNARITVVLPGAQIGFWKELITKHDFSVGHNIVSGGQTRTGSVKNGLASIERSNGVVGIHDGVRPCFSAEMVQRCFAIAAEKGNAIPVVPIIPSLRKVNGETSEAADRDDFRAVQTPQCFRLQELKEAYANGGPDYSDDASLMESFGHRIHLVEGDQDNIKVTYPLDVKLAELLLSQDIRS